MFLGLVPLLAWVLPCAALTDLPPAHAALPALPALAEFAAPSALTGSEGWLVEALLPLLPADVRVERDAFGSLIVRAAGASGPCSRVLAVGLDEPGYVVGQVRDDGYLRLRFLGRTTGSAYHLAREGRPARVLPRVALPDAPPDAPGRGVAPPAAPPGHAGAAFAAAQPAGRWGVVLVNSIHLKNPRPASLDEADLWLDIGADSAEDVAALGVGLLDPVELREVVAFGDRVAGPELGRRAAAFALLGVLRDVPREQWRDGLAIAFVAQSVPGSGALGRGGEGLLRRLQPAQVLLLAAREGGEEATALVDGPVAGGVRSGALPAAPPGSPPDPAWSTLELRVQHAGTPVECVSAVDLAAFAAALRAEVAR